MEIELEHTISPHFAPPFGLSLGMQTQPLSEQQAHDIKQVKIALNRLGFYEPDPNAGMNGEADIDFHEALTAFQMAHAIPPGDVLGPGSLSERVLNEQITAQDRQRAYIWRTVGDDKVRGAHAARNNHRFRWDDPPEGGHPGEDYGCRCWAQPAVPIHHPWIDWARQRRIVRREARMQIMQDGFFGSAAGYNDLLTPIPLDAINPTISPFDFIGGGFAAKTGTRAAGGLTRRLSAPLRDTRWITNASRSQIQHAFKEAKKFGIKGNPNNKTLAQFKKALEDHIKSPDTQVIKGTYHKKPVTHYYNLKTRLNIIRDAEGNFKSAWKLGEKQHFHMMKNGSLGGSK